MTGRLRAGAARLRAWIDCLPRPLARPPRVMHDSAGRQWALWRDGAWVAPEELPAEVRVELLERLAGSPYRPTLVAHSPLPTADELAARRVRLSYGGPPGPARHVYAAGGQLPVPFARDAAPTPCDACSDGLHPACTGQALSPTGWTLCACTCGEERAP